MGRFQHSFPDSRNCKVITTYHRIDMLTPEELFSHHAHLFSRAPTARKLIQAGLYLDLTGTDTPATPVPDPSDAKAPSLHRLPLTKLTTKVRGAEGISTATQRLGEMVEENLLTDMRQQGKCGDKEMLKQMRFYGPYEEVVLPPDGRIIFQATPDVVRLILVLLPTLQDGMLSCILMPQIRQDYLGNIGIVVSDRANS